jgi:hypothetical protein
VIKNFFMLVRQIGTVTQNAIQTDEQILLAEAGGGGGGTVTNDGGQQIQTLNPQTPSGAADTTVTPTSVPNVSNIGPGGSAIAKHPLLWAGLGAGAAYLLSRGGDTMSGTKKKNLLVPVLIAGGAALAWWFLKKPAAAVEDPTVTAALTAWAGSASNAGKVQSVVDSLSTTDRGTLYTLITKYFNTGTAVPEGLQAFWDAKIAPFIA